MFGSFLRRAQPPARRRALRRFALGAVDFASGLNISAFNLGISFGSMLGALMVSRQLMASSPWAGVAAVLLALLPLAWLARRTLAVHVAVAAAH